MIVKLVSPMATRWSASHVAVMVLSSCHVEVLTHVVLALRTSGSAAHTAKGTRFLVEGGLPSASYTAVSVYVTK